jgi:hypothetical protein
MNVGGIALSVAILAAAFGFGCYLLYKAFKGLKTGSIALAASRLGGASNSI